MNDHKNKHMDWPLEWEKCNDMFKYLNRMMWGYQLNIERRMLYSALHPEYRCVLVKWDEDRANNNEQRKREVLLETSDPAQMEATLFMLINEAEVLARAYKQKSSWIP
jgi:hypothetical protein